MNPIDPRHPDDPLRDPAHAALAARVRTGLEASAQALDGATLSRLNRARQRALDAARAPRRALVRWTALAATACVLVAAVALWRLPATPVAPTPASAPATAAPRVDDLALVAGGADLELVEDLEFYAWLDAQSADG